MHLRGYGAECAEVFFQTRSEYTREFARLTRDRLDGLPCTSVHPFGTAFENEFFGRSARQRADAMDMLRRVLDAAAELDARCMCVSRAIFPGAGRTAVDAQRNAEVVARMQEGSDAEKKSKSRGKTYAGVSSRRRNARAKFGGCCRKSVLRWTSSRRYARAATRLILLTRWANSWPSVMMRLGRKQAALPAPGEGRLIYSVYSHSGEPQIMQAR